MLARYEALTHASGDEDDWGSFTRWSATEMRTGGIFVSRVIVTFTLLRDEFTFESYGPGPGIPEGEALTKWITGTKSWFERLAAWIEVAVDQDLDAAQPFRTMSVECEGISVAVADGEDVSLPGALNTIEISMRQDRPVATKALRAAIARTDSGSSPSVARILLRDARVAARRNRLRIAAIDGGSALEAALAEFNTTFVHAKLPSKPTLGTYCSNGAISVAAHLPTSIKVDVLDIRNDAIHSNAVPSSANVAKLLSTVGAIVNRVDPLP